MDDLISRQAAIDALIRKTRPHDNGDGTTTICVMSEGLVREIITHLPTAEPRTGKWVLMSDCTGKYYACSWCGHDGYSGMNYCPNCGAKMEESDE